MPLIIYLCYKLAYLCVMDQETFDRHVDELLAAFRRGEEPSVHARAGRRALELAHAAIESFETGRRAATG